MDANSISDIITELTGVTEKSLMIDIVAIRQSYSSGEITNLGHVSTDYNFSGPLTKKMSSATLDSLLRNGKTDHPINLCIIHRLPKN